MDNSEHISKQYDVELESVRARVLLMGDLVERQVRLAIEALIKSDLTTIDRIIADDQRVNALEVGIDESCSHIIALRQPTANDLRLVMMVIKVITDLERIGDEAKKIAITAKLLSQNKNLTLPRFEKNKIYCDSAAGPSPSVTGGFCQTGHFGCSTGSASGSASGRGVRHDNALPCHFHDGRPAYNIQRAGNPVCRQGY